MAEQHHVVVDGSNLATEGRTSPSLAQLDEAVRAYAQEDPRAEIVVVVDASFEHRIDPGERQRLEEAELHGEVVSPPAGAIGRGDAFVLRIAERTRATVLSNDSFQEFHGEHPWLFDDGRLVGGKPVPGVGWIFTPRNPVRGPKSRQATGKAKRATALPAPAKAAELARAARKVAARRGTRSDGSPARVGDVWKAETGTAGVSGGAPAPLELVGEDGAAAGGGREAGATRPKKAARAAKATGAAKASKAKKAGKATKATKKAAEAARPADATAAAGVTKKAAKAAKAANAAKAAKEATKATKATKAAKKAAEAAEATKKAGKATTNAAEAVQAATSVEPGEAGEAARATKSATATKKTAKTTKASRATKKAAKAAKATEAVPTARASRATKKAAKGTAAERRDVAAGAAPVSKPVKQAAKQARKAPKAGKEPDEVAAEPVDLATRRPAADARLLEAIHEATAEALAPPALAAADGAAGGKAGGKKGKGAGKGSKRRRSSPPPAVNEPLAFINFVAAYPMGSEVEGEVASYTSHGAMIEVTMGDGISLHCYVPLTGLGDPPPRKAREVLARGQRQRFVLVALDPPRRVAELALPGLAPVELERPSVGA
ncbi:MAG: NYN domain-containing protein [Acidimicrobiales bacterium]